MVWYDEAWALKNFFSNAHWLLKHPRSLGFHFCLALHVHQLLGLTRISLTRIFQNSPNSLLNTYSVSEGILFQTQIYYTTWITQIFSRTKSIFMQGLGVNTSPSFDLFTFFLLLSHTQFTKFTCVDLMLIYVFFYFQLPKSQSSHKRITHDCMHTFAHMCWCPLNSLCCLKPLSMLQSNLKARICTRANMILKFSSFER